MGITTIKRIENRSGSIIQVLNRANSSANRLVGSGDSIEADIWIPGAPNPGDFADHHLEIVQLGRTRYWIWQAANTDGDFIRFSTDGMWHDQGERVHGYPGTAKNIFEAAFNFQNPDLIQRFGEIFLGDRALVVLDSHFEIVPISPKPLLPPLTTIKRIDNRSSKRVTVFNKEKKNEPTAMSASMTPLIGSADVNITIPWVVVAADFTEHRLEVQFDGVTRFWIWQEYSEIDGDYIRFSRTDGWRLTAPRVKGTAVTGVCPADLVFFGDRTMIVSDAGIELLPRPMLFDFLLDSIKPLLPSARRVAESPLVPPPPSVPKKSATAFSTSGPVSDAFKRGQLGARYLYTDSGKRYEFTINDAGTIMATDLDGKVTTLTKGWSYTNTRLGESVQLPPFDLIAASNGRIFAKAKGTDQFFLGSMDHMFIHASKGAPADAPEIPIPSTSFKLDPQFGTGASPVHLAQSTLPVPVDAPMSERFPVFHRIMHRELIDMMIERTDPEILYQLDYRPPQNVFGLALRDFLIKNGPALILVGGRLLGFGFLVLLAPLILFEIFKESISEALRQNAELGSAPLEGLPTYTPVTYQRGDGTQISPPVIKYERVLDIGVSHAHWFLQHNRAGGGEIQPLFDSESTQNIYRFFNGPVQDGDGFIDGTCNVYILVEHVPTVSRPHKFALLFQDEQWYFNQRWRLVDPEDNKGLMGGPIMADLKSNPEYSWNPDTYWCPFRNGHINDRSRLAVAAHVLLVTGHDPVANVPRIYSINFSWATIDRTWRHRAFPLPPDQVKYFDQATINAGNEPIQIDTEGVYPQTIRLREDMTIHLKGARNIEGRIRAGRWYQRYLPADNEHVPRGFELQPHRMPARGYTHPWKFLPENTFRLVDSFTYFGIYDVVDSRCQYYDVAPATPTDAATLDSGGTGAWIDELRQLYISQWKFRYNTQRPGADPVEPPSLFHPDTRLRILRRGSRWIATLWDKRDDDLLPFARLPMTVTLKNGVHTVRVTIGPHHKMNQLPMVRTAYMWLEPDGTAGIAFIALGSSDVVRDNVWRVRMAALEAFEDEAKHIARAVVVPLVDVTTEGTFTSLGFGRYERRWTPTADELTALRRYCSREAAMTFATSIWFEDVVGHVSVPESLVWQRSHSISTTASPRSIPLNRPVEVTVMAQDRGTQQPLDGAVRVNNVVVARTGQKFTHTFKLATPTRLISLDDGKPGPIEPTEPIPPVVSVAVQDYPSADVDIEFFTFFSGAAFVRQTVPTSMITGRTFSVSVTMLNTGTSTWTSDGPNPFRLGSQNLQDNSTWGFSRRELPGPVAPGAEVTFVFDVVAPAPGMHHFQWRMLQELIEWFGALTPDVIVQVAAPPLRTLTVSVTPFPTPLNVLLSVTVRAVDSQTGVPVAGRVRINNIDVASTNTPFNFTFRTRLIGVKPNFEMVYPGGSVVAPGYEPATLNFGFPEL
jgi:hypothetical protein